MGQSPLWLCLRELARDQGVQRNDLLEALQGDLYELRQCWSVNLLNGAEVARRTVIANLSAHIDSIEPRPDKLPLSREQRRRQFRQAVYVYFNAVTRSQFAELAAYNLTQRREWLASRNRGILSIAQSTSYRDFKYAITQIEQQILAAGYTPQTVEVNELDPDQAEAQADGNGVVSTDNDSLPSWSETLASLGYDKEATQARVLELFSTDEPPEVVHRLLYLLASIQTEFTSLYFDTSPWSTMLDDGLAVAALSGGWRRGFDYVAKDLFYPELGYHELARADRAKYAARQARGNKERARAALVTFAERGCLAISPGRTDLIATGINMYMKAVDELSSRRYMHKSNQEHSELIDAFRTAARAGRRLDLVGHWENYDVINLSFDLAERWNRRHGPANEMTQQAAGSHALMLDALRNSTLEELQAAHPLAMIQIARTIRFMLQYGTKNERIEVATYVLELQAGNRNAITGSSQEVLSLLMADLYQYGVRATGATQFADELASLVTRGTEWQDLSGSDLLARSRARQPRE